MTNQDSISRLQAQANQARAAILSMTTLAASGHPGGSMSSIDLLLALYSVIRHDPSDPFKPDRDRIVVSNGHVSPAVYAALALNGYHGLDEAISQFRLLGSKFEATSSVRWRAWNGVAATSDRGFPPRQEWRWLHA